MFINGGLQNDDCLETLTNELSFTSCKWLKRMNACDIYLIEK